MLSLPKSIEDAITPDDFDPDVADRLRDWSRRSVAFQRYLADHESLLARKLKDARLHEQQRDLSFELYFACALIDVGFIVRPEPQPKRKRPDLLASRQGAEVYIELRRLHNRQDEADWSAHCSDLRQEFVGRFPIVDMHLSVMGNYPNYRRGQHALHPLDLFGKRLAMLREFISDTAERASDDQVRHPVTCLPHGFATLTTKGSGSGAFTCCYPLTYLTEVERFIDNICRKSKQTVPGSPNLIAFWLTNIEETYDDFVSAVQVREKRLTDNPTQFIKRHKFQDVRECESLWRQCSGFFISDSEAGTPKIWTNPVAETVVPGDMQQAILSAVAFPFKDP